MSAALATRLPGVRVTAAPAQAPEALPRMDIAVFVGLAARGPLHLPVAVEDRVEFETIFGADAPLAWDEATGTAARALLGPAVRAFFANGGRRCWIVRVADDTASDNTFDLPGVVALDVSGVATQAQLRARSPGAWADGLTLSAIPQIAAQPLRSADLFSDHPHIEAAPAAAPTPGDLLAFTWTGADGAEQATWHALALSDETPSPLGVIRRRLQSVLWTAPAVAASPISVTAAGAALPASAASLEIDAAHTAHLTLPADASVTPRLGETLCVTRTDGQRGWLLARAVIAETSQTVISGGLRWEVAPLPAPAGLLRCDRISLDLTATGEAFKSRETGFNLSSLKARYVGALPDDATRYGRQPPAPTGAAAPGLADSAFPAATTFPFAGLANEARLFVPLFAAEDFDGAARHDGRPSLARDGLETFDASLFIDPEIAAVAADQVAATADYVRYRAPSVRRLRGAHVALGIDESAVLDEATLIVVPDAALPGWTPSADTDITVRPLVFLADPDPCKVESAFADCGACEVTIPALQVALGESGLVLTWRASDPTVECVVETAMREDFDGATEIYRGAAGACTAPSLLEQEVFFRVRADVPGQACGWGAGVSVMMRDRRGFRMAARADGETLLAVQQSLLRLCAARGDLMAVLSLPANYGADDAVDHAARLQRLRPGEERALSYGALYHPWIVSLDSTAGIEATPPDGAMAGVMAARVLSRGAWIAPANEPLQKALALAPAIAPSRRVALAEAGVNTLTREARGFLQMGAETLSLDPDLRQINVRRLLILVRRLALRHGVRYVFEPNDAALRRTVERVFEGHLEDLFQRGAFAGARPETAFQVDCGPMLNTPQGVEAGRFIVELRVAPSLPMRFLTVRLVQSAGAVSVTEGARS